MPPDELLGELAGVARSLVGAVEPPGAERLLTALAETARRLFRAQACSLALLTEDASELVYTTAAGAGATSVTGLRMPVTRGIAGWVVQSGQPVAVSDVGTDPRFAPDVARSTGYAPQALLAAPVTSDRGVLGVLTVLDRDASRPGADDDLLLLQVFCEQAAIALEGARAFRGLADVLLDALATAASAGTPLGEALDVRRSGADDPDLVALAGLMAELQRRDPGARRLAVEVARSVLSYVGPEAGPRPGG